MEGTETGESGCNLENGSAHNDGKKRDYRLAGCTLIFGEYGKAETQCRGLRGLCITDDTQLAVVADTINDRLQIIDPESFRLVRCIVIMRPFDVCSLDGFLFVTQLHEHRIMVFKENGDFSHEIERGDDWRLIQPAGITKDAEQGLLYVCDSGNRCVRVITSSGELVRTFGRQAFGRCAPWYITLTSDRIYISDSKKALHTFSGDGTTELSTISAGSSRDETEAKPIRIGNVPRQLRATGLTTDGETNLVVCDASGRLVLIDGNGCVISTVATNGQGQGQLSNPQGVAVSKEGDIIVCDDGHCRIVKYEIPWI